MSSPQKKPCHEAHDADASSYTNADCQGTAIRDVLDLRAKGKLFGGRGIEECFHACFGFEDLSQAGALVNDTAGVEAVAEAARPQREGESKLLENKGDFEIGCWKRLKQSDWSAALCICLHRVAPPYIPLPPSVANYHGIKGDASRTGGAAAPYDDFGLGYASLESLLPSCDLGLGRSSPSHASAGPPHDGWVENKGGPQSSSGGPEEEGSCNLAFGAEDASSVSPRPTSQASKELFRFWACCPDNSFTTQRREKEPAGFAHAPLATLPSRKQNPSATPAAEVRRDLPLTLEGREAKPKGELRSAVQSSKGKALKSSTTRRGEVEARPRGDRKGGPSAPQRALKARGVVSGRATTPRTPQQLLGGHKKATWSLEEPYKNLGEAGNSDERGGARAVGQPSTGATLVELTQPATAADAADSAAGRVVVSFERAAEPSTHVLAIRHPLQASALSHSTASMAASAAASTAAAARPISILRSAKGSNYDSATVHATDLSRDTPGAAPAPATPLCLRGAAGITAGPAATASRRKPPADNATASAAWKAAGSGTPRTGGGANPETSKPPAAAATSASNECTASSLTTHTGTNRLQLLRQPAGQASPPLWLITEKTANSEPRIEHLGTRTTVQRPMPVPTPLHADEEHAHLPQAQENTHVTTSKQQQQPPSSPEEIPLETQSAETPQQQQQQASAPSRELQQRGQLLMLKQLQEEEQQHSSTANRVFVQWPATQALGPRGDTAPPANTGHVGRPADPAPAAAAVGAAPVYDIPVASTTRSPNCTNAEQRRGTP
ncbi:uncharacterized protein LOC34621564 [Cyclospora cayetanensis]|uniref:Uncharacterized protein LOC34621564 n=1 Tax=Cyclospora cayetanensis TaxID=88456 RepID=A0A6P6S3N8_9EIME|nr:uncharacterized protein LOC34621564 [Cyclospora cayetanensis]